MSDILRKIGFWLCEPIYKLIPGIYNIFRLLAEGRFETNDILGTVTKNVYSLVSVIMLFTLSASLLSSIVNPDLLSDNKKGIGAIIKRSFIGVVLMVLVPIGFNYIYKAQESIISGQVVEKLVTGYSINSADNGKALAGSLIMSVIYPEGFEPGVNGDIDTGSTAVASLDATQAYQNMVSDITTMGKFSDYIIEQNNDDYAFNFNFFIAFGAGAIMIYLLLIYSIDMALRIFKLMFFEVTAPISIVAYIAAGGDTFKKWATEVGKTFVDVFIRIGVMSFYILLVSKIPTFLESLSNIASSNPNSGVISWALIRVLLIVGMLIFAKQIPDLLNKALNINYTSKGGISGRLKEMAVVGDQVSSAWNKFRNPVAAAAGLGSLALGVGSHTVAAIRGSYKSGAEIRKRMADNGHGTLGFFAGLGGGILQGATGLTFGTLGSGWRSLRNGVNNRNLHSLHDEYTTYMDTHRPGSNVIGRTIDDIREGTGFRTRDQAWTESNENLDKSAESIQSIRQAAEQFVQSADCTIRTTIDGVSGNYTQLMEHLQLMRNSVPVASDFRNASGNVDMVRYNHALEAHSTSVNSFAERLNDFLRNGSNQVINSANNGTLDTLTTNDHLASSTTNSITNALSEYNKYAKNAVRDGANNDGNGNIVGTMGTIDLTGNIAAQVITQEIEVSHAQGRMSQLRDSNGNLNRHGRAHADQQSRDARPGNNSGNNNNSGS